MVKQCGKSTYNVNYTFKVLYALGIMFIVMGHCNNGGFSVLNEFFPFRTFYLGLFVFASGYFYNQENELNVKQFIIKKFKKLIIPLYLWNFFYGFVLNIIKIYGFFPKVHVNLENLLLTPIIHGHQFVLNLAGWFIVPLFMIHIINILIRKSFKILNVEINEFFFFGIMLLMGFAGVTLSAHGYNNSWYLVLDRVLYFLPFYALGIIYKKYEKYDKIDNIKYFSVILLLSLIIIYKYGSMPSVTPSWAKFYTSNVIKPFYTCMLGIAFWLRISKILTPAIGNSRTINLLANNTYTIMINHLAGFMILKSVFAILSKYTKYCSNFDLVSYKTNIWYFYLPHNLSQFLVLYVITGIIFSIIFQNFIKYLYKKFIYKYI